jgi:hypothetical protein
MTDSILFLALATYLSKYYFSFVGRASESAYLPRKTSYIALTTPYNIAALGRGLTHELVSVTKYM